MPISTIQKSKGITTESAVDKIRQQIKPFSHEQARLGYDFEQLESIRLKRVFVQINALESALHQISISRAGALAHLERTNPAFVKTVQDEMTALNPVMKKAGDACNEQNKRVQAALVKVRELESK